MTRPRLEMRNLVLAGIAMVLTLGLLGAVGEGVVRYRERHRTIPPGTAPFLYYKSVRLRHALVRNLDYFGWSTVNAQGFRGARPVALAPEPGVLRIMAVGASTTWDGSAGDSSAWPARLETHLNASLGRRAVEVINAGVGGYRVLDNLIRFQTELHRYRPDVIILYHAHNDLFATLNEAHAVPVHSDRPDEMPTETPWGRWLGRNSLLYAKVFERVRLRWLAFRASGQRQSGPAPDWEQVLPAGADEFERNLESFFLLARQHGVAMVLPEVVQISGPDTAAPTIVAEPYWQSAVRAAPPRLVLRGYAQFNERGRRVAERFGALRLPTGEYGLVGDSLYLHDDPIHFSAPGSDRFARRLAEALIAAGLPTRAGGQVLPRMASAVPEAR